jgi:hypothetical protein
MVLVDCSAKSQQEKALRFHAFTFLERTTKGWLRKHSLTPELITFIDWDACKAAMMGRLPFGRKHWLLWRERREFLRGTQDHEEHPRFSALKAPATQLNAKAREPAPPLPLLFRNSKLG